jgi:hypothetical protein
MLDGLNFERIERMDRAILTMDYAPIVETFERMMIMNRQKFRIDEVEFEV